ncbi:MAG TPA: hypothetical protein VF062_03210 [Candidatus Limnocylindrales bacterium]
MAIDVVVELDRLQCIREHDGSGDSEPYLWTAVVAGSSAGTEIVAPGIREGARVVVKSGMRAGDRVQVPPGQRRFTHRFPDGASTPIIVLVVALLEKDSLPGSAVNDGYRRFLKEVEAEVRRYAATNDEPPTDADIKRIARTIRNKVKTSVQNALSPWEKGKGFFGVLDADDPLDFKATYVLVDLLSSQRFELEFKEEVLRGGHPIEVSGSRVGQTPTTLEVRQHYKLTGRIARAG